ncbi:MAG: 23S rRNA (uracil(1939)-C(5))-methyltransferase RlmD [Synergistaceae bacterium]|jgi:23S rRNA (uracil1939-C5)-methyltransferase|nr:23S rRNA (uracil(1939)-C(5))-methyltransferase RlmD [Synergistaceae bacterium]
MSPGDILTVKISSINSEGEGLARIGDEAFVLFVPGALPGETVSCRVTRLSKKYASARVLEILSHSPSRITPKCPQYGDCGGCQLQHANYETQIEIKRTILTDALKRIGHIEPPGGVICEPSPERWGYRNKTTLPVRGVGKAGKNALSCGYYERRTHNVVSFWKCAVLRPSLEKIIPIAIDAIAGAGFKGYNEAKKTGDIRHFAARTGSCGEVLTGIVASREFSARESGKLKNAVQRLCQEYSELAGAVLNVKTDTDNFIWGPVFKPLGGARFVEQRFGALRFNVDISSFFQVNSAQTEVMFNYVKKHIKASSTSRLLELYSGVGSLTSFLAGAAEKVDAVEEWRPAARQLRENMLINSIENVEIHSDSAEKFLESGRHASAGAYDTIVLDPPRTGCDERVTSRILQISPRDIIYVSCDPATLARDISRLVAGGYSLESVAAFDMFPQTAHVESVTVMSRE